MVVEEDTVDHAFCKGAEVVAWFLLVFLETYMH
jgi:hypothetical protein